jgi:hypothetical protein
VAFCPVHIVEKALSRAYAITLLLALAFAANAETITGRVVGVADGDTITVLDGDK